MYKRLATGEPSVVDVSLMSVGMWQVQPDITHSKANPDHYGRPYDRKATWNPLSGPYKTRDGRFIHLNMLDANRYWADFCTVVGHPELIDDPRYLDMPLRKQNARTCVERLDEIFASRNYVEWCVIMKACKGVWAPMQKPVELHSDQQALMNGYLSNVEIANGTDLTLVTSPAQFDEEQVNPMRAPELGEHTESALLAFGLSWDEVMALKEQGAIG